MIMTRHMFTSGKAEGKSKLTWRQWKLFSATHKFNSREIRQIVSLLREHEGLLLSVWERLQDS